MAISVKPQIEPQKEPDIIIDYNDALFINEVKEVMGFVAACRVVRMHCGCSLKTAHDFVINIISHLEKGKVK